MSKTIIGLRDLARLGSYLVDHWVEGGGDLDGGEIFDWLTSSGVIEEIPGGFDSEKHEAGAYDVMDGDPWLETTKAVKDARRWMERNDEMERAVSESGSKQAKPGEDV